MGRSQDMHLAAGKNGINGRTLKTGIYGQNFSDVFRSNRTIRTERFCLPRRHPETNQAARNRKVPLPDSHSFRWFDDPEVSSDATPPVFRVRPDCQPVYASGRTSFVSLRPSEKSRTFCRVVCAMLSSASRVKNPWCEVTITLLNDSRRASISSPMIRSEVSS